MFLLRLTIYLFLIQVSFSAQGTDFIDPPSVTTDNPIWIDKGSESGLVISLPTISPQKLVEQLIKRHSELEAEKSDLTRLAEESKFSAKDGLIAAVMPGGLIYAAYVSKRHENTVSRLATVNRQLTEFSEDLSKIKAITIENRLLASAAKGDRSIF